MDSHAALEVVGVGNAIVDVIAAADDAFLAEHGMHKGSMALVDEMRAQAIYAAMGPAVVTSGGSAANTIAGIASFGGRTGFIGKVRDDALGTEFRHDITAVGARFSTAPSTTGPATACCLILVTPDSQRTMNTFLGASAYLSAADLDEAMIRGAALTYLEGYLYDAPSAQHAFHIAAEIAHEAGRKVAFSLSDPFCVERHRAELLQLVDQHVDILFANQAEIASLFETNDFNIAVARVRTLTDIAALTRGPDGSVIVTHDAVVEIAAERVNSVVDTTGAGDLYAAGFLFGLTHGVPLRGCGRLGSLAAAEVIGHFGARPQTNLRTLVEAAHLFGSA
ncbi:MAG: adenosine kinase [Candidatus Eremiobacteraeota bacterium]|nr:adenosine kinase [Candidatus Eremiobacteraeota bacterium]